MAGCYQRVHLSRPSYINSKARAKVRDGFIYTFRGLLIFFFFLSFLS